MTKQTIRFSDFRQKASSDIEAFSLVCDYLRAHGGTTLIIEPGVYTLSSPLAIENMEKVMNGEFGANPQGVMFSREYKYTRGIDFEGISGANIIGDGAKIMVEGFMEPISIRNCRSLRISGITLDHIRKPYSQGKIESISPSDEKGESVCTVALESPITEKSPRLRSCLYSPEDGRALPCTVLGIGFDDEYHLKIRISNAGKCHVGDIFCMLHTYHGRPAILIEGSSDITLDGVTIHSNPGMGIVGNRCENVFVKNTKIVPSEGQYWSTNTDATHFTSMKGQLVLENCMASHQGDDFTNVHAYYQIIVRKDGENVCYIRENTPDGTHTQSLDYPDIGDILELTEHKTLRVIEKFKVIECTPMSDEWQCRITLDHKLPDDMTGLMFADITRLPELTIKNCLMENHYARGLLIKTRSAEIIGNTIRNIRGAGIEVAAESWWYEGVCPANIEIRDNLIENCGYAESESGGILVKADCENPEYQTIENITIENNTIISGTSKPPIFCRNVKGLVVKNNILQTKCNTKIEATGCNDTLIEE